MKKLLLSLTLISTFSQQYVFDLSKITDQRRPARIEDKLYIVKYTKISEGFSVPATYPAGQPHHSCICVVYFMDEDLRIGEMPAQWTPNGCFEDNPQMIAEQVLEELRNNL